MRALAGKSATVSAGKSATVSASKSVTVSASKSATVSASKRPETQLAKGSAKADTLTVMKNNQGHQISI